MAAPYQETCVEPFRPEFCLRLASTYRVFDATIERLWLTKDVVAEHKVETVAPRLVGVSAYVHALGKFEFSGLRILHVEIDVENEVADLLDGSPRSPVRTNPVRNVAFASVAVLDPRAPQRFAFAVRVEW